MAVRHITAVPVGAVLDNKDDSIKVSNNLSTAKITAGWDNFKFLSSSKTGNDGTVYKFSAGNDRHEFESGDGFVEGFPCALAHLNRFRLYDKVGHEGSYVCQMGYVTNLNQDQYQVDNTFMKNVVGFDVTMKTWGESTSDVNEPWVGNFGLVYIDASNREWIFKPTVTHYGPTGDIPHNSGSDYRVVRSIQYGSSAWKDIHEQELRFTGFIWEWGHGARGGAVTTKLNLFMYRYKPILSYGINSPLAIKNINTVEHFELIPRLRSLSDIDTIDFSTHDINSNI